MPRINPVLESEKQIGRRLRQFRQEITKLTSVAFSREIGIDASRLASYEHGRVLLPFDVAWTAAVRFGINLAWLAEARSPMAAPLPTSIAPEQVPARASFSSGFETIKREIDSGLLLVGATLSLEALHRVIVLFPHYANFDWFPDMVARSVKHEMESICSDRHEDAVAAILEALRKLPRVEKLIPKSTGYPMGLLRQAWTDPITSLSKIDLTKITSEPITTSMLTWPQLKAKLARLTKARGAKAELADHCKVTRAAVGTWLSDKSTTQPGAEATLKLLKWVEDAEEEQKQKSCEGASTPAQPKTQSKGQYGNTSKRSRSGKP